MLQQSRLQILFSSRQGGLQNYMQITVWCVPLEINSIIMCTVHVFHCSLIPCGDNQMLNCSQYLFYYFASHYRKDEVSSHLLLVYCLEQIRSTSFNYLACIQHQLRQMNPYHVVSIPGALCIYYASTMHLCLGLMPRPPACELWPGRCCMLFPTFGSLFQF